MRLARKTGHKQSIKPFINKACIQSILLTPLLALPALLIPHTTAEAYSFDTEDGFSGRFDTEITAGVAWRTESRDDDLVGEVNGGTRCGSGSGSEGCSANGDDGNLNYDNGDQIFRAIRMTNELAISYENFGFFGRSYFLIDFVNKETDKHPDPDVREHVGRNAELMDAYVYTDFELANIDIGIRIGKQVVNWGEATFIPNGINTNPIDVAKLRVPGGTLEDALTPFNQVWGLFNITENLAIEGWYQLDWQRTEPDPVGTYHSSRDFLGRGGNYVMLGFASPLAGPDNINSPTAVERGRDRTPEDTEQGGIAIRYVLPDYSRVAFYAQRYHTRIPLISGQTINGANFKSAEYFEEYPEDVDLYGIGFDTELFWGLVLQGEYAFRHDQPLQIDDIELLFFALGLPNQIGPFPGTDTYIQGFRRFNTQQLNLGLTKLFTNFLAADQWIFYLEAAAHHVNGFPDQDDLRFEGPGTSTSGGPAVPNHPNNPVTEPDGFATASSWGYRLLLRGDYSNVLGNTDIQPRLVFFHDVNGTAPTPGPGFVEGSKRLNLGATFEINNRWQWDVGYTWFWGGDYYNRLGDRDNVSTFVRYSF